MCEWGLSKPWEWAQDVSHLWRTTGDIRNNWNIPDAKEGKVWGGGVIINLDMQEGLENFAGPGHWNDPDMLEVGNGVLSESESRAHFSLWCMLAAPLMAGNDLTAIGEFTRMILTNKEIIAIDQDLLGKQGFKIRDFGEFEIYYKSLEKGDFALCLFNRYDVPIKVEMDWKNLECRLNIKNSIITPEPEINRKDIPVDGRYSVRDLWEKKNIGENTGIFKHEIPAHDVVMLRLKKL
jgi:alpha-galactosidase